MLGLWNFWRGFVTVQVTGFSVERFINLAIRRGVYMWDAERAEGGVRFNISIRGFKTLKACAQKTGCRFKIIRKEGWPFLLHRYRRRKVLLSGAVFFILALYALTSFVWRVDIQGNERLPREEILAFCESAGLKAGAFKYALNAKDIQRALLNRFPDISWAEIHIRGTSAAITMAETIPKQTVLDRRTPCDIVAAQDGLITRIVTGAGKPLVKVNDVVKENEVLVSGTLEMVSDVNGDGVSYVHSFAEVWAKRYTPVRFNIPYRYTEKVYTGKTEKRRAAQFLFAGGYRLNLPGSSISFKNYDKITRRNQWGVSNNYPLPLIFITDEYYEYTMEERIRTPDEAKALAEKMINAYVLREFDFQTDIMDKQWEFDDTSPDGLTVNALITTNERIDKTAPIP